MWQRKTTTLAMVIVAVLIMGRAVSAHEGHEHKILGTVTMAAADHVMLKDRAGKDVTVLVTKDTKVRATPALKVEQIKAGTRVVIMAIQEKDKSFKARLIEVGAAPAVGK